MANVTQLSELCQRYLHLKHKSMSKKDDAFFDRADAHIRLSNEQLANVSIGKVSASMLFGTARFNAFISACNCKSVEDLKKSKEEILQYFTTEYEKMLKENLNDYITNFDKYMVRKD